MKNCFPSLPTVTFLLQNWAMRPFHPNQDVIPFLTLIPLLLVPPRWKLQKETAILDRPSISKKVCNFFWLVQNFTEASNSSYRNRYKSRRRIQINLKQPRAGPKEQIGIGRIPTLYYLSLFGNRELTPITRQLKIWQQFNGLKENKSIQELTPALALLLDEALIFKLYYFVWNILSLNLINSWRLYLRIKCNKKRSIWQTHLLSLDTISESC